MANPYQLFKNDEKTELEHGIVLDYNDFRVRIARAGGSNKKFGRVLQARLKPYRRQMETETMQDDVAAKIMAEVYADTIILGWVSKDKEGKFLEGVHDPEGNVVSYSREAVIAILIALPDLFRDIQIQAANASLFRSIEQEKDAKNLSAV